MATATDDRTAVIDEVVADKGVPQFVGVGTPRGLQGRMIAFVNMITVLTIRLLDVWARRWRASRQRPI